MDHLEKIKELCEQIPMQNDIETAMKTNEDNTKITDLIYDDNTWQTKGDLNVAFYAYSEKYIYFLDYKIVAWGDGETSVYIASIPRNPTSNIKPVWLGGYE